MFADPIARPASLRAAALPTPARASPCRLQLPKRDADDLSLRQRLQNGVVWPVDDPQSPWASFELTLAPPGAAAEVGSAATGLALGTPHGVFHLEDDTLIAIATGAHLARGPVAGADLGLLRLACAAWPPELSRALGGAPTPVPGGPDMRQEGADQHRAAVLTLVSRDGGRHAVPLRASPPTLMACATAPGWRARPARTPMPTAIAAILLEAGLWMARVALPASRLLSVRPGDAFWIPSDARSESGPLCVFSGTRLVHLGQVNHLTREFQGWGLTGGSPSNSLHAFSPPTEPRNVDALTVDLDFIVGRVAMTVGELSALAAGQIVPLEALTPASVRIVAHGTELGAGQLVEIEGRLAVEILTWGSPR
jgi:flagellar motor switch/type III secretory pathway protein FliN